MYFVDFVKNLIKKNNRGVLIWLIINSILVACLLGEAFGGGVTGYALGVVIYVAILALSLSPLGESILRWQNGCEKITRKEYLDRIMPLFNEVFSKAKTENPEIPDDVQIYMVDSDVPNAFATGRKTVCITKGLLHYPEQQIKAVLAHEFGHLAHKDTDAILIIAVGNLLVSTVFIIFRIIVKIISFFAAWMIGFMSESFAEGFVVGMARILLDGFLCVVMHLWTKFGALLCLQSSRNNENLADKYSFDLGYGESLCIFLDHLPPDHSKGLWATLNSSHPKTDERIAYLQELGCAYRQVNHT